MKKLVASGPWLTLITEFRYPLERYGEKAYRFATTTRQAISFSQHNIETSRTMEEGKMSSARESTQEKKLTLVLGGTGKTGRRVVERLTARGLPVRIGSRSGEPPFDWEERATWAPALDGVGSVYLTYYPDLALPGAVEAVASFAKQAVQSGAPPVSASVRPRRAGGRARRAGRA